MQMDPGEILRDYMSSKTPVKQIKILAELNCCESQDIVRILREQGAPIPKIYDPKPKREPMAPQEPGTAKKTPTHALTVGVLQQILGHVPGDTPIQVLGNGVANYVTFLERYEAGTGESRYVLELGREERP